MTSACIECGNDDPVDGTPYCRDCLHDDPMRYHQPGADGPTIGALFAGYGGLELATQHVIGGRVIWYADNAAAPAAIMAHHHPGVPNLGDVTALDWSVVGALYGRPDVITGGTPCQDLSHAGPRRGFTEGTRSNLWVAMREAIAVLRPTTVIWENVRGALSARADSKLEPCPGCVGDRPERAMRALGRVLGDMASLRYDCRWRGIRASDIGAPHQRWRVFVVAHAQPVPQHEHGDAERVEGATR